MPPATLSVRELYKFYGPVRAVQGVSFEAQPGRVIGLLGPNGAGKTTTMRVIAGSITPDGGEIRVGGLEVREEPLAVRARVGYLADAAPAYAEMRVEDYLLFRAQLTGIPRRERQQRVERAMERCRVIEMRRRRAGELSRGYRQRLGLASAILPEPDVLLLDEPTNGLDPAQVRETRELVRELGRSATVVVSSHALSEVEKVADELVIIAGGRVAGAGTLAELAARSPGAVIVGRAHASDASRVASALAPILGGSGGGNAPIVQGDRISFEFALGPAADADALSARLSRAIIEAGGVPIELTLRAPSLEKIYLELIERATPAPGDGRAA
ncbi:MAG: ABC transporter ATP-binding protein [Planctomycetota bacterium]|nr:ABC transporter ATP-binding protein [Planctomycetota bacterium]